jgi:type I restriction enzyme, S subunit
VTGLPEGWVTARFEEVVAADAPIIYGILQPGPEYPGGVKYIRPTEIQHGVIDLQSVRSTSPEIAAQYGRSKLAAGDVILSIVGTIGKVALVPHVLEGANITQSSCRLRPDRRLTDERFLQNFLKAPQAVSQYDGKRMGTAVPRLNLADVRRFEIPLPPLPEQRRIVRKLDTLSARSTIARTHITAIEKLVERYKRAVLAQFFPDGLPKTQLGKNCIKIGSGATPRGGKNVYLSDGTPLIRSQNVRFEGFDWDGLAFISDEHADELRNVTVITGDVLLNITGASIGRVCLAPEAMDGARVNQHVSIIRPKAQEVDARYIQYFLSSPVIQNWIWNENYGVTRQALTKGMIEDITIPDVSLDEQREIVRRIETAFAKIDRLAAEATKALKLLGHLDQRILAKAFAGDLVPQDPNDEPAETLLARIRTAREAAPKTKRKRKTSA